MIRINAQKNQAVRRQPGTDAPVAAALCDFDHFGRSAQSKSYAAWPSKGMDRQGIHYSLCPK
ncbi:hypothetical protein [Rhizobium sp. Root483D2]|uniref:hypothetical protein n=1 Tax=Rhizobium sp. Root483D2 TaxID=1736545 RepID=UPI000AADD267|nr:hypothetical protein [Rhizobium sp. Root483D2]